MDLVESPKGGAHRSSSDRAGRASPQAPLGLDHSATIPCAWNRDPRIAVIGLWWDPTPQNIAIALRDRRDWFEREVRRLTTEVAEAGKELAEVALAVRYLTKLKEEGENASA